MLALQAVSVLFSTEFMMKMNLRSTYSDLQKMALLPALMAGDFLTITPKHGNTILQLNSCLALSPFNLEAYDQHAEYDCPVPLCDEKSCSDSSIITISPYEADSQELDHSSSD